MCVCLYETQREGRNCDDSACSFPLTSTCKRRSRLRRTSLCLSFSLRSLQLPMLHKPASSCSARLRRTLDLIKSKTLYSTCLSQQTHRAALADFFQLLHQPNLSLSLSLSHAHTLSLHIGSDSPWQRTKLQKDTVGVDGCFFSQSFHSLLSYTVLISILRHWNHLNVKCPE